MPDRHAIILSALRAIADCITEQVTKLGQQTVEIEAKEAQQEEEKRKVLAQLTQAMAAATRPHFPFSIESAKTPSSTEAAPSPQCAQPQPPPDSDSTLPKPVRKRGGDWILAVHRVFSLCSQRGLPMPGESDLPDFHDPLLVPEQWVMEYEARLRAAASPNPVQTEFDSLNSLDILLFELRRGEHIWRIYANGKVEGFPEGTLIMNRAMPLLSKLQSLVRKQELPAALLQL